MRPVGHICIPVSAPRQGAEPALIARGLDLMLIDSALEHLGLARRWMAHQDSRDRAHLLEAAVLIVGELRSSLDLHTGGPHAANLDDLCDYMSRQLVAANAQDRVG